MPILGTKFDKYSPIKIINKGIKNLFKILIWGFITLTAIPTATWLLVQSSQVQTYLIHKTTDFIYKKTGIYVSIQKIDFRPFNSILLKNVYLVDLSNDTLLFAKRITASLSEINTSKGVYHLGKVQIGQAKFYLIADSTGQTNLNTLIEKLQSDTIPSSDSSNFILKIEKFELEDSRFRLMNIGSNSLTPGNINFQNLYLSNINIDARNIFISSDTVQFSINTLSALDHSGFELSNLRSHIKLCSDQLHFNNLRIRAQGSSLSMNKLYFNFVNWNSFSNFSNEVRIDADFEGTYIKTATLAYIVPMFQKYNLGISINGAISGYLSSIKAKNLEIGYGSQTKLILNARLDGLPAIDNTLMSIDIKELTTTPNDLNSFSKSTAKPLFTLSEDLKKLETVTYSGRFSGYTNDFVTYGILSTSKGSIQIDLSVNPGKNIKGEFKGKVSTKNFRIGELLEQDFMGKLSMLGCVNGTIDRNDNIKVFTDANIQLLELKGYQYKNIQISGNLGNNTYVGTINLNDPNCRFDFLGKVDFSDSIPVYDFSLYSPRIDLAKLNLNTTDSISVASFLLTTKFKGSTLDNSQGEIKVVNMVYRNQQGEFKISDLTINADNQNDSKIISLKSDIAEGEIRSRYSFAKFPYYLRKTLAHHIPALGVEMVHQNNQKKINNDTYNDYLIKFRIKKIQKVTSVLAPSLKLAENSTLFGILDPDRETLTFKLKLLELVSGSTTIKDLSVDGETRDSTIFATISTPEIALGSGYIRNLKVNAFTLNNRVNCNISWNNNTKPTTSGSIQLTANFDEYSKPNRPIIFNFSPSSLVVNDSIWQMASSQVNIDTATIKIANFSIYSKHQYLNIYGKASELDSDTLSVNLKNFDISYLNLYLQNHGFSIKGTTNGNVKITAATGKLNLNTQMKIENLSINNETVGNISLSNIWYSSEKRMSITLRNHRSDSLALLVSGNYYTESNQIDINSSINRLNLSLIAPLLEGNVSNLHGYISGNLQATGTASKPIINGFINFNEAGLTIDFLKTHYIINDRVKITNSNIVFSNFKLTDKFKRASNLNGTIETNYFKNFKLGLRLSMKNFLCMNTRQTDNESFYGTVFATGMVDFEGATDNLNLKIGLKTENRTAIYLPLSTTSTVEQSNFISFVSNEPDIIIIEEDLKVSPQSSTNINILLDLEVTPEAEAQIIIDKKLGDIIKANGSGNLRMEINPSKNIFKMFGRYTIEKGDYLFTLSGVINKRFRIEQGSYIDWNGEPLDANMNINAVYRVKTTLKQLLLNDSYTARTPVDCKIILTQTLMSPSIRFGIEFPNLDQQTKLRVEGLLNTEERVNTQFLGLLVVNSFISDPGMIGGQTQTSNSNLGTTGLYNTASELLSNQLSNWLSQWSQNFDIGINYRPGLENELSSDQLELAFSTQILDDRVSINGNFDVPNNKNTSNTLVGDFTVDVKLTKNGKLKGKAFARNNNEILPSSQQNNYTTGAGIVYREDFNSIRELFNSFFTSRQNKSNNKTKESNANKTNDEPSTNSAPLPNNGYLKIN